MPKHPTQEKIMTFTSFNPKELDINVNTFIANLDATEYHIITINFCTQGDLLVASVHYAR